GHPRWRRRPIRHLAALDRTARVEGFHLGFPCETSTRALIRVVQVIIEISMHDRGCEEKGTAFVGFRFVAQAAAVLIDDLPADGESDARAGVPVASVQPLEDLEEPLAVLRRDADPIVAYREDPALLMRLGPDMDKRRAVAKLERIA